MFGVDNIIVVALADKVAQMWGESKAEEMKHTEKASFSDAEKWRGIEHEQHGCGRQQARHRKSKR